ncbi:IclR family transcriptional regulator [Cupriavidus basilensis]
MNTPVEQFIAERRKDDPSFGGLLAKGFALLRCFIDEPRPLGNGELSERLQLPRATVSRICRTLFELGYLDWDPKLDKYFVGAQVLALGYPYLAGLQVRHVARPLMQALADRIEGAVSMGVAHRLDVTYLLTCTHNEGTPARPGVGAVRSVLSTGMGRAFLSTLSKAEFETLMQAAQREASRGIRGLLRHCLPQRGPLPQARLRHQLGRRGQRRAWRWRVFAHRLPEPPAAVQLRHCGVAIAARHAGEKIAPMLMEMTRSIESVTGLRQ